MTATLTPILVAIPVDRERAMTELPLIAVRALKDANAEVLVDAT